MEPTIVTDPYDAGFHNTQGSATRVKKAGHYKDQSVICIRPVLSHVHGKVFQSWENLAAPMNQRFLRMTPMMMEVGAAYTAAIELVLGNPALSTFKYILTLEHD